MSDDAEDLTNPEVRRRKHAEGREWADKKMREHKARDRVDRQCHEASVNATDWAKQDGLHPVRWTDRGEPRYSLQQGLRAAHVGREDSAATLILMRPVLYELQAIKWLIWSIIVLLAVILWRVW